MGLFSFLREKFSKKPRDERQDSYEKGLRKSRAAFSDRLKELAKRYGKANGAYFEELEEILIEADVGVAFTLRLVQSLMEKARKEGIEDTERLNEELVDLMFLGYVGEGKIENEVRFAPEGPTVLLMTGVNGVGKTTTIAKLALRYQREGKKVMLVAGDTFRAGAREQLSVWAERLSCPIVLGKEGADPASLCYEGAERAKKEGIDLLIVDTAGRLQTKQNLMAELSKMRKVLGKIIPGAPHETFLVIDATTGQNGVSQAKAFEEATPLTGIVITKMDGTSKGGIILAIRDEIGVPVRFIGLGERMEDLREFDLEEYLHALLLAHE